MGSPPVGESSGRADSRRIRPDPILRIVGTTHMIRSLRVAYPLSFVTVALVAMRMGPCGTCQPEAEALP